MVWVISPPSLCANSWDRAKSAVTSDTGAASLFFVSDFSTVSSVINSLPFTFVGYSLAYVTLWTISHVRQLALAKLSSLE